MKRRLSFRSVLQITLLAVTLGSLATYAVVSFRLHHFTSESLTAEATRQSLLRVTDRLDELIRMAVSHEQLYEQLAPGGELTSADFLRLFEQLWTTIAPHDELAYIGVGIAETGEYGMLARQPDNRLLVRLYVHDDATGPEIRDYRPTAAGLQLERRFPWANSGNPKDTYDLHERPFFKLAAAARRSIWTDSYAFWGGEFAPSLGVTYATPIYDAAGTLKLVWDIDLDLDSLTRFLTRVQQQVAGRLVIAEHRTDNTWQLIIDPSSSDHIDVPEDATGYEAVAIRLLQELPADFKQSEQALSRLSHLHVNGKTWHVVGTVLTELNRPDWVIAELLTGEREQPTEALSRYWFLASFLAIGLLASVVAFLVSRYVARPLQVLEQEARWLAAGERTQMPLVGGPAEIGQLSTTLDNLATTIRQRQSALEAAIHDQRITHERLEVHFRDTPVGVLELDRQGMILGWNPAAEQIFGWQQAEVLHRRFDLIVPVEIRPHIEQILEQVFRQRGGFRNDNQNVTKDGRTIDCEWYNTPLIDESGYAFGAACLVLDVTERTRAEAEIRQLNEELESRVRERTAKLQMAMQDLESFSYSVAHDLRAPLRSINGFSQALEEDCAAILPADGLEHLRRIRAASQRMAELLDALLRLTRVVRQEAQMAPVNLTDMVRQSLQTLQREEPNRQVTWELEPDVVVEGDRQLLQILIDNVCNNAWKYSRNIDQARLKFFSEHRDDGRWFALQDNGVGFDANYAHKAIEPFQRLHREEEFEGHGIGLATAARIAQKHGGAVQLAPAPGGGAICWFRLEPSPH